MTPMPSGGKTAARLNGLNELMAGPCRPGVGSANRDATRFRAFSLWQNQGNYPITQLGRDLVLVDHPGNPKAPPIGTDIVFAIDGLQTRVLVEIDPAFNSEHAILDTEIDIFPVNARHLQHQGQSILGLEDVGVG